MITLALSIVYLALLECLLSVDNAVALAALVHAHLSDPADRQRALRWGIAGAYIVRFGIIGCGLWLLAHPWVKALAGGYLVYMAVKELCFKPAPDEHPPPASSPSTLWKTILLVELTDLMFSVDSIAVTLSVSQTFWALAGGGVLGIALMRFAAGGVVRLLDHYPILEKVAFVLVALAGVRLLAEFAGLLVSEALFAAAMLAVVVVAMAFKSVAKALR